jgi:hypothetical protein
MKPKLLDLPSTSRFAEDKRTEILIRKSGDIDFQHHCDALVIAEGSDGFLLVCASPCGQRLGYSFCVRRVGFPEPVAISLSAEISHIRVQGKDFGYIHQGAYQ